MRLKTLFSVVLISYTMHSSATLTTESEKLSYSLGSRLAEHIKKFEDISPEALSMGIMDVLNDQKLLLPPEEIQQLIQNASLENEQQKHQLKEDKARSRLEKSHAFLSENSKASGVITLQSGLQYKILNEGDGPKPEDSDTVLVYYEGRLLNGSVFDSSYERKQPASLKLNQVITGWTEGLQKMSLGSIWELYIPPHLAYGTKGLPGYIGPNEALTFRVELKEIL